MIYGVIVLVGILLLILIWVNIKWAKTETNSRTTESTDASDDRAAEPLTTSKQGDSLVQQAVLSRPDTDIQSRDVDLELSKEDEQAMREAMVGSFATEVDGDVTHEVEVMTTSERTQKLFNKPQYPFKLYEASVPEFGEDVWKECFRRLTEDSRILGWVAFQNDKLGAADGEYESTFIEVLRTYRQTVETLRKEVGMTSTHESSVIGEEGKLWFITAVGDAWLALFLENHSDPKSLSERLLEPVLIVSEE